MINEQTIFMFISGVMILGLAIIFLGFTIATFMMIFKEPPKTGGYSLLKHRHNNILDNISDNSSTQKIEEILYKDREDSRLRKGHYGDYNGS